MKRALVIAACLAAAVVLLWPRGAPRTAAPPPPRETAPAGPAPPPLSPPLPLPPPGRPTGLPAAPTAFGTSASRVPWRLTVAVTDSAGRPVEGAAVAFYSEHRYRIERWNEVTTFDGRRAVRAGADGRATLLATGWGAIVACGPAPGSVAVVEVPEPPPEGSREIAVSLPSGRPIHGTVVAPEPGGVAPQAASVVAIRTDGPPWLVGDFAVAMAGEDGRFALGPLPPGRYALTADSFTTRSLGGLPESVYADAGDEDVVVRTNHATVLTVKIVETGEDPPRGRLARVAIFGGPEARTLLELQHHVGDRAVFRVASGRKYRIEADCDGWSQDDPAEVDVLADADEMEVSVPLRFDGGSTAVLQLRIRDEEGEPIDRISFRLLADSLNERRDTDCGPTGELRLRLSVGRWRVWIGGPSEPGPRGPLIGKELEVELAPGESVVREIVLHRAGRVNFEFGEIESGPWLRLEFVEAPERPDGHVYGQMLIVPGTETLLFPGHYVVEWRDLDSDSTLARREFDVRAGETVTVSFE